MADIESMLNRWQSAGILDVAAADRIRAWESGQQRPARPQRSAAGLAWQGVVALILGGILLATGAILFVSAHWDDISPGMRFALVVVMAGIFHLAGGAVRELYPGLSTGLHAVGTIAAGPSIILAGQIFHMDEHWPAAFLLWAIAALAGWILLHDQVQQTFTLVLLPAWIFSELKFATEDRIGQDVYLGRFLLVWATLYLTVFLFSRR